jgi:hypothetical protein
MELFNGEKFHSFGIKEYCYSSKFSSQDVENIIDYLNINFYNCNNISLDRPGYQTPFNFDLLSIKKIEFEKLKNAYLESIKKYVNQKELIDKIDSNRYNINSWCYMNWKLSGRETDNLPHYHNLTDCDAISGIFYLRIPKNRNGETQFHLGGNKFKLPSKELSWFIFPSNYAHIPGEINSFEKRYVISADIWFN